MANINLSPRLPQRTLATHLNDGAHMGLMEHLDELRRRLFKAAFALVLGTMAGMFLSTPVLEYLQKPYGREFVILGPTGGVVAYFRIAVMIGAAFAIPMITYQVLMFILPALTNKERRVVLLSLPAVTLLFVVGVLFAWFVLIPPALGFLENFQPTLFKPEWTADLYLSFVTTLVFWMGVAFEVPLIFFVLALLRLLDKNVLLKNWRIAIVGSAVAAALITPTIDPVNMMLVMGPLMGLYLLSILLVMIGNRMRLVSPAPESEEAIG